MLCRRDTTGSGTCAEHVCPGINNGNNIGYCLMNLFILVSNMKYANASRICFVYVFDMHLLY